MNKPILLLLLLALAPAGWAQELAATRSGEVAPPQPPFVAPVPAKARWTIAVRYDGETASAPGDDGQGRVRKIESARVGTVKQDTVSLDGGKTYELWFQGGKAFKPDSAGTDVVAIEAGDLKPSEARNPNLTAAEIERGNLVHSPGFPGFDWVKEKYYDGVVTLQGVPCHHYILGERAEEGKPSAAVAEAWINAKTGMPVAYAAEGAVYTYTFLPPPESLTLPPLFQKTATEVKRMEDRLQQLMKDAGR